MDFVKFPKIGHGFPVANNYPSDPPLEIFSESAHVFVYYIMIIYNYIILYYYLSLYNRNHIKFMLLQERELRVARLNIA